MVKQVFIFFPFFFHIINVKFNALNFKVLKSHVQKVVSYINHMEILNLDHCFQVELVLVLLEQEKIRIKIWLIFNFPLINFTPFIKSSQMLT